MRISAQLEFSGYLYLNQVYTSPPYIALCWQIRVLEEKRSVDSFLDLDFPMKIQEEFPVFSFCLQPTDYCGEKAEFLWTVLQMKKKKNFKKTTVNNPCFSSRKGKHRYSFLHM